MANIADILGGAFVPSSEVDQSKEVQLAIAISNSGIEAPDYLIFDGEIHRFSSNGKGGDKAGWYIAYDDSTVPSASFGDWRSSQSTSWRANIGRTLTIVEDLAYKKRMSEAKIARDIAFAEKRELAAETALSIYTRAGEADDSHPYLVAKGIKAHGIVIGGDGRLIVPVFSDGDKTMSSLQYIDVNGGKQFLTGGKIAGCWHQIGSLIGAKDVFIAEGYATASSIFEATDKPCVVAFNAGNLPSVAKSVRDIVGITCNMVICADLDASGVGVEKAKEAAKLSGARVVVSPTSSDFNDAVQSGVDIVNILMPTENNHDWLIHADQMDDKVKVNWHIKRWLPRNSLIMVHGPSGSGKSLVVLDMVSRIASTVDDWEGHKVRHSPVIYLAGEGYIGMNARLKAWKMNAKVSSLNMWISRAGCGLNTPEGYQLARDSIMAIGNNPGIIVIDTLHRFMVGDENSAQDAGDMIKACGWFMDEFKCSVLLVHHTGVAEGAQSRARGSSAWKGAMESEISIVPQTDETPLEVVNIKAKDSAIAETKYMRIHGHIFEDWLDEDDEPISGAYVKSSEMVKKDSKKDANFKDLFEEIAQKCGTILDDGRAFVTENDWSNFMVDENGVKTPTLRNKKANMKKEMLKNNLIELVTNGYAANFEIILLKSNN